MPRAGLCVWHGARLKVTCARGVVLRDRRKQAHSGLAGKHIPETQRTDRGRRVPIHIRTRQKKAAHTVAVASRLGGVAHVLVCALLALVACHTVRAPLARPRLGIALAGLIVAVARCAPRGKRKGNMSLLASTSKSHVRQSDEQKPHLWTRADSNVRSSARSKTSRGIELMYIQRHGPLAGSPYVPLGQDSHVGPTTPSEQLVHAPGTGKMEEAPWECVGGEEYVR